MRWLVIARRQSGRGTASRGCAVTSRQSPAVTLFGTGKPGPAIPATMDVNPDGVRGRGVLGGASRHLLTPCHAKLLATRGFQ